MAEDHTTSPAHQDNPIISFFVNLFASIKLPFPLPAHKKNATSNDSNSPPTDASSSPLTQLLPKPVSLFKDEEEVSVVTFPKRTEDFDSLKLQTGEGDERTTNPLLLWQVYAIGGFFVMKWAWTRWNERKGAKKPGDEAPPADD